MALEKNESWVIIDFPPEKRAVSCKYVFIIKYKMDDSIERLKNKLVVLWNKLSGNFCPGC